MAYDDSMTRRVYRELAHLRHVIPMAQRAARREWARMRLRDLEGDLALRESYLDGHDEARECLEVLYAR